jgi:hypothetical protein
MCTTVIFVSVMYPVPCGFMLQMLRPTACMVQVHSSDYRALNSMHPGHSWFSSKVNSCPYLDTKSLLYCISSHIDGNLKCQPERRIVITRIGKGTGIEVWKKGNWIYLMYTKYIYIYIYMYI